MSREEPVQSFNEKAALAELERLRESIQVARKARQRTSDEFEAFVKGFRTPGSKPISEHPVAAPRAPELPHQAVAESITRPVQSPDSLSSTVAVPPHTDPFDVGTAPPLARVPRRYGRNIRLLGVLGVIAVIALGLVSTRWSKQISPPAPVNAVTDSGASTRNAGTPTSAAPPLAPPQPAPHSVVLELRTVRQVWMRVVVDGRKDVEGMVQGGEPLHFAGDQSIVVRVGNGGDVLVKTENREEPFGDAGQPVTRKFSKP